MTNQHPITPLPELVRQWQQEANHNEPMFPQVANQAAQWGADKELNACCEWFVCDWGDLETADKLRDARRPQPLSLKEQALSVLDGCSDLFDGAHQNIIRQALEQLND